MNHSPNSYRMAGLLRRQFQILSPGTVLLVAIVLLTSLLLALWPRFAASSTTAELHQALSSLSPEIRNPQAISSDQLAVGPAPEGATSALPEDLANTYGAFEAAVNEDAASAGAAVSGLLGAPRFRTTSRPGTITNPPDGVGTLELSLTVDPFAADHLGLVEGKAPSPVEESSLERVYQGEGEPVEVQALISRELAEEAGWKVGETRQLKSDAPVDLLIVPTGIFEPKDPESDYWAMNPEATSPSIGFDSQHNTTISAQVLVDPSSTEAAGLLFNGVRTHLWHPLELSGLTAGTASSVEEQLALYTGNERVLEVPERTGPYRNMTSARFETEAPAVISDVLGRTDSARGITTMMAAGPLGIALATLLLAVRIVVGRRRTTLALASARGASVWQLRGGMALEGLALGLPAAVIGVGLALVLVPGPMDTGTWLLPLLFGLSPAALLGLGPLADDSGGAAAEPPSRTARHIRWALELLVLVAAGLAWWLLDRPGRAGTAAEPLLAAAPLLLALLVCLVVLRLMPLPLAWLVRSRHSRAGLSGFLGPARALRAPAGGMVAVLALLLGLSMATFSAITLSTLDHGIESTARAVVGADLRLTGTAFSAEQSAAVANIPWVSDTAGLSSSRRITLKADSGSSTVRLVAADADRLGQVQADYPGAIDPDSLVELGLAGADPLSIIASDSLGLSVGDTAELDIMHGTTVRVVAVVPSAPGPTPDDQWVLADRKSLAQASGIDLAARRLLIDVDDGADTAALQDRITALPAFDGASRLTATTPGAQSADLLTSPTTAGLKTSLVVLVLFSTLLCALVVLLVAAGNAPARNRLLALLRTLGFPARDDAKLLFWELGPTLAAAAIGGVPLGLLLPHLLSGAIDLLPFTRGAAPPGLFLDASLLSALLGSLVAVVLLSVAVAAWSARRHRTSTLLRIGD